MNHLQQTDPIDRILTSEAPILPTSGFALSVMDSIRAEAAEPARKFSSAIRFPWARVLPGAILALALLVWVLLRNVSALFADLHTTSPQLAQPTNLPLTTPLTTIGWLFLALAASLLPLLLIRKMMGRSALL